MSKISNIPGEEPSRSIKNEDLLPVVFRTDINKKMLDSSANLMTSKGKMQPFYQSYGTQNASDVAGKFLTEDNNVVRKESQTNLAINYYDSNDEYKGKFSYIDLDNYFKIQGLPLKDGVDLDKDVKSLQLPISQFRTTDYQLYYWLPEGLPPFRIHVENRGTGVRLSVANNIVGKPFAILTDDTSGKTVTLSNYQKIFFTGAVDDAYRSQDPESPVVYIVLNVGNSIRLVPESFYEKRANTTAYTKLPWDEDSGEPPYMGKEWAAAPWDTSRYLNLEPEYVLVEQYAGDRNPWSIINCWHHVSRIREVMNFYDLKLEDYISEKNRAQRPIIQLSAGTKLFNWPTTWITEVETVIEGTKNKHSGIHISMIKDKYDHAIAEGKLVAFTEEATIYRLSSVIQDGQHLSVWTPTQYVGQEGAGIFIVGATKIRYYSFIFKNNKWQPAQNKIQPNQCPLIDVFDENGVSYSDSSVYYNSNFIGARVLDFAPGTTYDPVLKRNIKLSDIEFDALPTVSDVLLSGPNQLQMATDIDHIWTYDVDINEKSTSGVNYYKFFNVLNSFWNQRTGLDITMSEQVIEYTEDTDLMFSAETTAPVDGFNTIHVFENENRETNLYFYLKDYGMVPYTSRRGSNLKELILPVISSDLYSEYRIVCHNLSLPLALYENKLVDGYSQPVLLPEPIVQNNNISHGVITVNLESTYIDSSLVVQTNPISVDDSKFLWNYNNQWRLAITRPIDKFKFITNAFLRDRTVPLYNGFDYRNATNSQTVTGTDVIEATKSLSKKALVGDKIVIESPALVSGKKTAPYALSSNPGNEGLSNLDYYSVYQHLTFEQSTSPNSREFLDPGNTDGTYNALLVPLGSGTIHKHNQPIGLFGLLSANTELDLIDTITKQARHYDTFMSRFKADLQQAINRAEDLSPANYQNILTVALKSVYVNQVEDTFWHHSNMIGWGIDYKENSTTLTDNNYAFVYPVESISFGAGKELLTHIFCNGIHLQRGVDYNYTSNIDGYYTGVNINSRFLGQRIVIRQWAATFSSRIPASLAKLGLSPLYMPEIYRDTSYSTDSYFIIRHDGTRYYLEDGVDNNLLPRGIVDALLFEYEKMVFSGIAHDIEQIDRSQYIERTPGYFRQTKQSQQDVLNFKNASTVTWQIENSLFVLNNDTYDTNNKFTYRYVMPEISGSWRAVYRYLFDTDRPHTHPWEMLGYTLKPAQWDTYYSWTDPSKRQALINVLLTGRRIGTHGLPYLSRYVEAVGNVFPVTNTGELLAPMDVPWIAEKIINVNFDSDFAVGELSPQEFVFKSTQRGLSVEVTATYLLNALKFVNELWRPGSVKTNRLGINTTAQSNNGWNTGSIDSNYHRSTSTCFTSGIEALLAEHYILQNKDFYADIVDKSNHTKIVKEILLSGFTNKSNLRIQSTSINSQRTALYVPEENFSVRTVNHYKDNEYFYSGLRIIWTGQAWMIYGFVNETPYFSAYTPNPTSTVTSYTIGNFTYREKNTYNKTVVRYPYGHSFTDKQELYDFIKGYGYYLEDRGFIFDQVESNDLKNWQLSAKQFAFWSGDPLLAGNYIDLNPAADVIKIKIPLGQLDNLVGNNHLPGLCVTRNNKSLFSKDLVVTRNTITEVKTKDTTNPIYGIKFTTSTYESVIHLDETSVFNDIYFLANQRLSKRRFLVAGKKTQGWSGRLYAPGYYFYNNSLYSNLDNIADQGRNFLSIEDTTLDTTLIEAAKSQFGLDKNAELRELFLTEESELQFKNSVPFIKGTNKVFTSLEPLTHTDGSSTIPYNEYLVKLGEFGSTEKIQFYEFQLRQSDYINKKQIVNFNLDNTYSKDQAHNITRADWVYKPKTSATLEFLTLGRQSMLETTGPVAGNDTNYSIQTLDDIDLMYNEFKALWSIPNFDSTKSYAAGDLVRIADPSAGASIRGKVYVFVSSQGPKNLSSQLDYLQHVYEPYLPNFFVNNYSLKNTQLSTTNKIYPPATWQVMQTTDANLVIKEACPGLADNSKVQIETIDKHYLRTGDKVLIVNTDQTWGSVNGIWTVERIDDKNFYIPSKLTKKIHVGKVFTFKTVRFATQSDLSVALQQQNGYRWFNRLSTTESSLGLPSALNNLPKTLSGYSQVKPLVIVDQAVSVPEPATSWDTGGYISYQINIAGNGQISLSIIKNEQLPVLAEDIEHVIIWDHATKQTVAKIELFDPIRLVIPKTFTREIDVINRVDPARYNRTSSEYKAVYSSTAWYDEKVGKRWWDTSTVKFTDYKIGGAVERSLKWALENSGSTVDVYEWTKSSVHPAQWADSVRAKTEIYGQVATGSAYSEIINGGPAYNWTETEDYVNGKTVKVYYFWVRNKTTINLNSTRTLTAYQLSKSVLDPTAAGIPWCTPLTKDTMMFVGLENILSETTVVQIKRKATLAHKHQQWMFIADYNSSQTIPEFLHIRLRDSLASAIFDEKYYGAPYNKIMYLERPVPDHRLHPFNRLGNSIRPYAQSWFIDLYEARRTLIKEANIVLKNIDVINSIAGWNRHLNDAVSIGEETVDVTQWWSYVDYTSIAYDPTKSVAVVVGNNHEAIIESNNVSSGQYIKVANALNQTDVIYEKTDNGLVVVWRKDGTIAFNELSRDTYDKRTWDGAPWDHYTWDDDLSLIFYCIIEALRRDLLVIDYQKYYNKLMCVMFRQVLSEQFHVDWLTKASTIQPYNLLGADLRERVELERDSSSTLINYFKNVKSFRDKLRDSVITKNISSPLDININDPHAMNIVLTYDRHGLGNNTDAVITGLPFVDIGWDDEQAPWDKLPLDPIESSYDYLLEKIYTGLSGIPAEVVAQNIAGPTYSKYKSNTNLGEELVNCYINESNVIIDVEHYFDTTQTSVKVRTYYNNQTVRHVMMIDSKSAMLVDDLTDETTFIKISPDDINKLPEATIDSPQAIWIDNEKILYFIKTETGITRLIRGVSGTSITDHSAGSTVYVETAETVLPYNKDFISSHTTGPFFSDQGESLDSSTNSVSKILKSNAG
jgi:hypothetical protein